MLECAYYACSSVVTTRSVTYAVHNVDYVVISLFRFRFLSIITRSVTYAVHNVDYVVISLFRFRF